METEKSQDQVRDQQVRDPAEPMVRPSPSPKRAKDATSNLKASRLQTQEELSFAFQFENKKRPI